MQPLEKRRELQAFLQPFGANDPSIPDRGDDGLPGVTLRSANAGSLRTFCDLVDLNDDNLDNYRLTIQDKLPVLGRQRRQRRQFHSLHCRFDAP